MSLCYLAMDTEPIQTSIVEVAIVGVDAQFNYVKISSIEFLKEEKI